MKISIFGLGYVGCVSLGCLAQQGHKIIGVDINKEKVDFINRGEPTIVEKEIDQIISEQHDNGRIYATKDTYQAVHESEVSIITVGTPSTGKGHLDLGAIFNVAKEIGAALRQKEDFHVVIIRSTVLPGTNRKVTKIIENESGKTAGKAFAVVSNPEFLREGSAVKDYYNPAYTVIGTSNQKAIEIVKKMYSAIDAPFYVTEVKIAELIKYVNNAFHANKIVFANEVGNICKKLDIDSHELMQLFSKDTKLNISPSYLMPGFSYGGSCLPKDLKALTTIAHDNYLESRLLESISKSNDSHKKMVLNDIIEFGKKKIGFLGLSFKGGTDDLRNSPIIDVIEILLGKGYDIKIFDRNVYLAKLMGANKEYILNKIPLISKLVVNSQEEIIEHADLFVIVNKDDEYKALLDKMRADKIVYDLVNLNIDQSKIMAKYIGVSW